MVIAEKKKGRPSRFCLLKSESEEQVLADEPFLSSTKYKNKWALKLFREWQQQREMKVQSNLDYPDLDYPDFSIIRTSLSGPIFFHEY